MWLRRCEKTGVDKLRAVVMQTKLDAKERSNDTTLLSFFLQQSYNSDFSLWLFSLAFTPRQQTLSLLLASSCLYPVNLTVQPTHTKIKA